MAEYKHGTYGEFADSIGNTATQSGTVAVYIGTAPVNLVRGYTKAVNSPVRLTDYDAVKRCMGRSDDWGKFTLCEPFKVHFDNASGNVGPIIAINVLDPAIHKKTDEVTKTLNFTNGRAVIESDTIILDTLVLADKTEGVDFTIDYDFTKGVVVLESIGDEQSFSAQATYSEVDPSAVAKADIIGGVTAAGVYTGLGCVQLIYQELNMIPNLIAAPAWSEDADVYEAMIVAGMKVNGHWDANIYADLPVVDANSKPIDTIDGVIAFKAGSAYNSERSKVFWPQTEDVSGRVYHASVLAVWRTMLMDTTHGSVPMESPSNKQVPIAKQYFGKNSKNRGFDKRQANKLNEVGITTVVYWGGQWVLWGPHTAAYKHGAVTDQRVIFDNSIRMMMYVSNSFQQEHALTIDSPMTRAMADTIKNREQEKADALATIGALIGVPVVEFKETDNSTDEIAEGNFVWSFQGTPTPPFKSGTMRVAYTSAGFDSYFEGVQ